MNLFKESIPTFIESWPMALRELSMKSFDVPLNHREVCALGSNIIELFEFFPKPAGQDISDITKRIDYAIKNGIKGSAFVKLGSRSPKDSWYGHKHGFKVNGGAGAIKLLTDVSERIMEDLLESIRNDYIPRIWVRQWVDIPKWSEFRCFVYKGELIGISQYFYNEYFEEIDNHINWIKDSIVNIYHETIKPACHLDTYIYDVYFDKLNMISCVIRLIEINPFIDFTDFCLYNDCRIGGGSMSPPDFSKFDRGIRYVKEPIIND
jgi:hypothetical protein